MARGRKRKFNPLIPSHIDQAALPRGLYWGDGRWYVVEPHPEGGNRRKQTVAYAGARLSELHGIIEERAGKGMRGTLRYLFLISPDLQPPVAGSAPRWVDAAVTLKPTR